MPAFSLRIFVAATSLACFTLSGCNPQLNPTPPKNESASLGRIEQLTHGFARAGEAYFSPDSRWIIFQAAPKGEKQYSMYLARLTYEHFDWLHKQTGALVMEQRIAGAEEPIRISPDNSRNTCGFFSSDANSLIFASAPDDPNEPTSGYQRQGGTYRWDFPNSMEIYRADGWLPAVTAVGPAGRTNLAQHPITRNDAYDAECAFSPDGKWIVFCSRRTGDPELFAMRPDGSHAIQLTHSPGYDGGPFFSPDGRRLVYRSDRHANDLLQIFTADLVLDRDGNIAALKNERQLTNDNNVNWAPFWHPDAKHIIYTTSAHGHDNYELYLMRADGSRKTRITFTPGFDGLPAFSPDGRCLIWSSKRSQDNTTQVFTARFFFPPGS